MTFGRQLLRWLFPSQEQERMYFRHELHRNHAHLEEFDRVLQNGGGEALQAHFRKKGWPADEE